MPDTPPTVETLLQGVLATLSATVTATGTGHVVSAGVGPKPGTIDVTQMLQGVVDVSWLTKKVNFADANLEPASLDPTALVSQVTQVTAPVTVPGLLGQVHALVPMLNQVTAQVSLEVTWEVLAADDTPLAADQFSVLGGVADTGSVVRGTDIALAFRPTFAAITKSNPLPPPTVRKLKPKLKVSALGKTQERTDIPAIPVPVPAVGIPKLLGAFRHTDFRPTHNGEDGFVLLFAPADTPLQSVDHLKETLSTIQETVTTLKSFTDIAALLPGVSSLVDGLTASPYFVFVAATEIKNLNDITAIQRAWYQNDTELEDEISSLVLIGPAGAQMDMSIKRNHEPEEGWFRLTVGAHNFTVVHNLHSADPNDHPEGNLEVKKAPASGVVFGDQLSSMKWI